MTTKLIVLAGFIIAFAAGLMTGKQSRPPATVIEPTPSTKPNPQRGRPGRGDPGMITRELGLSPEQSVKMREIWDEFVSKSGPAQDELRLKLRQQRDRDMLALVPEDKRADYEKVQQDFSDAMTKMDRDMRASYDQTVEKTKQILNPDQLAVYEKILDRSRWDRGRGGRGGPGGPGGGRGPRDDGRNGGRIEPATTNAK